jgi:hypothetical protein
MVLAAATVAAVATGAERATAAEGSLRYSAFVVPSEREVLHGWQASLRPLTRPGLSFVIDGAGYYASGDHVHILTAGPRLSTRPDRHGTTFFAQVLAGGALISGDEAAVFAVAQPGIGVDVATDKPVGFRLQADWPLLTTFGVVGAAPRISAGVVLRPRVR